MDIANILWLDSNPDDSYWETSYRRSYTDRDIVSDFYEICEVLDGDENAGSPLARHERLAEAMYE